jgi:hypothetical protein
MRKQTTIESIGSTWRFSVCNLNVYKNAWAWILLVSLFAYGCRKDDFTGEVIGLCPTVTTDPMDKAIDVVLNKVISATFNTDMKASTINNTTFIIKQGTTVISGIYSPDVNGKIFLFKPNVPLLPFTTYNGTITTGAKDTLKTSMVSDYLWTFTTMPQVRVSASPAGSGTATIISDVRGDGTFANGSVVTVNAAPSATNSFVNWTDNGTIVSTSSSYQFTLAGNRTLVANFAPVTVGNVILNLSANPAAGGTTNGAGQYNTGSTVTATALPNAGYAFVNWTDNGVIVSPSSSYQFVLAANRNLVANFNLVPSSQFSVALSSNPAAGGSTGGSGSFNSGATVTVTATPNTGYTFSNWTENGVIVSTTASYPFLLTANRVLVANFLINTYTLNVTIVGNGTVAKNPDRLTYNHGTTVQLTATPVSGSIFSGWSGADASGSTNPLTITMNSNKNVTATFVTRTAIGPLPIDLGTADDFSILTKSGISTTGVTLVNGDIGVSPIAAAAITGFGLIMDPSGQFSRSTLVVGRVYASDYAVPTPSKLSTAISDMETAYNKGMAIVTPSPITERGAGNISGLNLTPGLYKWSTGVLLDPNTAVTLTGGANDTWVFQIAQNLTISNSANITLAGGAQAKNIFWVVAGQATLGTSSSFNGILLSKTLISLNTGAKVTGILLAQTAVTLNASTVNKP